MEFPQPGRGTQVTSSVSTAPTVSTGLLPFDLFVNLQDVAHLIAEISNRILHLGMANQQLYGSKVTSFLIDECGFVST